MKLITVFENNIRDSQTYLKRNGATMLVLFFGLDFKSHRGWRGCYCTTEAPSRIREVRGNYSTKSKVAECVKRLYLDCVFELLGAFEISPNLLGEWGRAIDDTNTS